MKRRQNSLVLILAVLAGFMGGAISSQIPMIRTALAQKNNNPQKVIEANEFRLIDKYGNQIASLKGKDFLFMTAEFEAKLGLKGRLKDIKIQTPVLEMTTLFPKLALTSNLTSDALTFSSLPIGEGASTKMKITSLYADSLSLLSIPSGSSKVTHTLISDGSINVFHGDTSVVALGLSDPPKNLPHLRITDTEGNHAVLGQVLLKRIKTGTSIERSAASLVLFDKKGNVIWSTPE